MTDWVTVDRDRFFALLSADGRDIMPSVNDPDVTIWETPRRELWGRTTPGWRQPGQPKTYEVTRAVAESA